MALGSVSSSTSESNGSDGLLRSELPPMGRPPDTKIVRIGDVLDPQLRGLSRMTASWPDILEPFRHHPPFSIFWERQPSLVLLTEAALADDDPTNLDLDYFLGEGIWIGFEGESREDQAFVLEIRSPVAFRDDQARRSWVTRVLYYMNYVSSRFVRHSRFHAKKSELYSSDYQILVGRFFYDHLVETFSSALGARGETSI